MIIIGYQGIGKSTCVKNNWKYNNKYIDLESSCMRVNGERANNWYETYTNIAEDLSRQGFIVFVSSHKEVRYMLCDSSEEVYVCYPSLDLKDKWITRLIERYNRTGLDKDYRALKNAEERYSENIMELKNDVFNTLEIENMSYELGRDLPQWIRDTYKGFYIPMDLN